MEKRGLMRNPSNSFQNEVGDLKNTSTSSASRNSIKIIVIIRQQFQRNKSIRTDKMRKGTPAKLLGGKQMDASN